MTSVSFSHLYPRMMPVTCEHINVKIGKGLFPQERKMNSGKSEFLPLEEMQVMLETPQSWIGFSMLASPLGVSIIT